MILFNALLLGLETSQVAMAQFGTLIKMLDVLCLAIFVVELVAKLVAYRTSFLKMAGICLILSLWRYPSFLMQSFSVLRALRIFRILRVVSAAPRLRRVVEGFVTALPGMASVFLLMGIIFYIGAVIATKLFGAAFPEWFGSLARSAYSLFQIMTLESWSMGIVRPVMEKFPYAWAFFIPFIMVTTFAVVNLLVGLIVNSMQDAHQDEENQRTDAYRDEVMQRLKAIEAYLERSQSKKDS